MSGGKSSSFGFAPSNKRSVNVFAVPYFKDVNLYSHPPNADTLAKRNNGELDVYCTAPREWTKEEQKSSRDQGGQQVDRDVAGDRE